MIFVTVVIGVHFYISFSGYEIIASSLERDGYNLVVDQLGNTEEQKVTSDLTKSS